MTKITINGIEHTLDADPNMPILYALRDLLRLTGTKFGCGIGQCGACTVHLNGNPIRSCLTPISVAADKEITTIEGLSNDDELHPVAQAWLETAVPQCGYCQSGQIMSAAALLQNNKQPTETEIESAMQGNICRCGTYPRIKQAITLAAKRMSEEG